MKPKFRPANGHMLLQIESPEEKTKGGLFIPDAAKEKPLFGKVVAVAKGRYIGTTFVPLQVEEGMTVLISKYNSGTEVEFDGEKYLVLHEDFVLGIKQ